MVALVALVAPECLCRPVRLREGHEWHTCLFCHQMFLCFGDQLFWASPFSHLDALLPPSPPPRPLPSPHTPLATMQGQTRLQQGLSVAQGASRPSSSVVIQNYSCLSTGYLSGPSQAIYKSHIAPLLPGQCRAPCDLHGSTRWLACWCGVALPAGVAQVWLGRHSSDLHIESGFMAFNCDP